MDAFSIALEASSVINNVIQSQNINFSPVILTQPPSARDARRNSLAVSLELLEAQWSLLDEIQKKITTACNTLRRQRSMCRSALSPISALPHEILVEIFLLVHLETKITNGMSRAETCIVSPNASKIRRLSEVCNDWRTIALKQPKLWAFGRVRDLSEIGELATVLERSGSDFSLTVDGSSGVTKPDWIRSNLREQISSLSWNSPEYITSLFQYLINSEGVLILPHLRNLSMTLSGGSYVDLTEFEMPELRSVEIRHGIIGNLSTSSTTIRSIDISDVTLTSDAIKSITTRSPSLERLYIDGCYSATTPEELQITRVVLPLKEITFMDGAGSELLVEILDRIRCPQIEFCHFQLADCQQHPGPLPENTRRGPDGSEFSWYHSDLTTAIYETIQNTSSLTELKLHLPILALQAAFCALTPTLVQAPALATLEAMETTVRGELCHRSSSHHSHDEEDGREAGRLLANALDRRNCRTKRLRRLLVSCCLLDERLNEMVAEPVETDRSTCGCGAEA